MDWTIPGTVLPGRPEDPAGNFACLQGMFLAGGLSLGQITYITGLEPHMVQNWVKRGFLPPPQRKQYSFNQLCRILCINMMRGILSIDQICSLLTYVNGKLDDESDDIIDDASLYRRFLEQIAGQTPALCSTGQTQQRIANALGIMLTAWQSAVLKDAAEEQIRGLNP